MWDDFYMKKCKEDPYEKFIGLCFSMFQIDLLNFFQVKHILYQKLRIQPSEIERMPYYELEYLLKDLKDWLEKEKEEREKEEEESKGKYSKESMLKDSNSMMKKYSGNTPSAPKMPNIRPPKL